LAACRRYVDEARRQCEISGNRRLMLSVWTMEVCLLAREGDLDRVVALSSDTVRAARALKAASAICDASANAAVASVEMGRFAQAAAYGEEALAAATALGERSRMEDHIANLCWIYHLAAEPQASRRTLAKLDAMTGPGSLPLSIGLARGFDAAAQGDFAKAAHHLEQALSDPTGRAFVAPDGHTLPWLIEMLILSDQDAKAADLLQRVRTTFPHDSDELRLHLLRLEAMLAWRQGKLPEALECLDQAAAVGKYPLYTAWALADAAWVQLQAGHEALAVACLQGVPEHLMDLPAVLRVRTVLHASSRARAALLSGVCNLPSRQ
jgi:tetratricopeptide (TPR) repeat protein